jgi:hypothetical protein
VASKNETCQNSFENVHNFAHVCRSKLHLNPNDLAGRVSLKKRINYVTFIGRCRTHPTSGVSSIKLSFCLEHTCHWASLVSGHQETWISPKKVSLYGRPLWMHTGNNSHGGKWDSKKSFAATQVVLQPPIEKGGRQVWGIRQKKTSQKRPQKLGTYPRRSFRAAAPVWQSAEEAEMLKTSRWNLQMRGGSSSEMLPKEIKQQQQSRPYH